MFLKLTDKAPSSFVKIVYSFIFPPTMKIAILVEQSSLVIKPMCDLVSNDHTNATKVQAAWKVTMVKRRLKYASRDHDLVLVAAIVGIDYSRGSVPHGLVHFASQVSLLHSCQMLQNVQCVLKVLVSTNVNLKITPTNIWSMLHKTI